jgi:hypothetical protein
MSNRSLQERANLLLRGQGLNPAKATYDEMASALEEAAAQLGYEGGTGGEILEAADTFERIWTHEDHVRLDQRARVLLAKRKLPMTAETYSTALQLAAARLEALPANPEFRQVEEDVAALEAKTFVPAVGDSRLVLGADNSHAERERRRDRERTAAVAAQARLDARSGHYSADEYLDAIQEELARARAVISRNRGDLAQTAI